MASTTTNLLLKVWNNLSDKFNHTELAQNWAKVDAHDHTGAGKGLLIPAGALEPGAVLNTNLAADAVDTNVIVNQAITQDKIAPQNVITSHLAERGVTAGKLAEFPAVRVRRSTTIPVAYNVPVAVEFDLERWDNSLQWNAAQPTRLTCKLEGMYNLYASVAWANGSIFNSLTGTIVAGTGRRESYIRINGADIVAISGSYGAVADHLRQNLYTNYRLEVDDYIELVVYQNQTGNTMTVATQPAYSPELGFIWAGQSVPLA